MNQPNFQLREKRPVLPELSVWKTTNINEPNDITDDLATVQNLPSDDELALEPSYSDTLSYLHTWWCSKSNSLKVTFTTCNVHRVTQFYQYCGTASYASGGICSSRDVRPLVRLSVRHTPVAGRAVVQACCIIQCSKNRVTVIFDPPWRRNSWIDSYETWFE